MSRHFLLFNFVLLVAVGLAGCQSSDTGPAAETSTTATSPASETVVMTVHGMSCPLCASNIDKQLLRVRGVHSVNVDLSNGIVTMLVSATSPPSDAQLVRAVEESGFTVAEPPRQP